MTIPIIVEIQNLQKSYGQKSVLQGIDLQITSGQIIGYIGPNGAGKSTTVKILCGLINDFQGEVTIFDRKESTPGRKKCDESIWSDGFSRTCRISSLFLPGMV